MLLNTRLKICAKNSEIYKNKLLKKVKKKSQKPSNLSEKFQCPKCHLEKIRSKLPIKDIRRKIL